MRFDAGERHEREDGNENCGVMHGVDLCGNAPRLLGACQTGVKAICLGHSMAAGLADRDYKMTDLVLSLT